MTTFQKIAALILRLLALGLILYSCVIGTVIMFMGLPRAAWGLFPFLIAGIILHFAAIPLSWLITRGIDD